MACSIMHGPTRRLKIKRNRVLMHEESEHPVMSFNVGHDLDSLWSIHHATPCPKTYGPTFSTEKQTINRKGSPNRGVCHDVDLFIAQCISLAVRIIIGVVLRFPIVRNSRRYILSVPSQIARKLNPSIPTPKRGRIGAEVLATVAVISQDTADEEITGKSAV